jgi:superoxide dismutase, Fe-Mn family
MFRLPALPYAHDALGSVISETTLRTHHGKHHAKYVEMVNALLAGQAATTLESVVRAAAKSGDRKLFNNAGQAWNHAFFWACMTPKPKPPSGALAAAITTAFGGIAGLRERFLTEGVGHFGSGWVWLVADGEALSVVTTHDGDTAVTGDATPLLVCDLWEHAYYLDHKNDRAGFLAAWWDRLVNWDFVASQYEAARGAGRRWSYADAEQAEAAGV